MSAELNDVECAFCHDEIDDECSVICLDCEHTYCNDCLPDHKDCPGCTGDLV